MKDEALHETRLYSTWRETANGGRARRVPVRAVWHPESGRYDPPAAGDVPPALAALKYPTHGNNRDDRYQADCLAILQDAQHGARQPPARAYASVGANVLQSLLNDIAVRSNRAAVRARRTIARLRARLFCDGRHELLDLLDSFDADGSGLFDFAGVAKRQNVSLATAYRWRRALAAAAREVMP